MTIIYFILAILALGLMVFIHELGHFLAARAMGMVVEAFSIGFGPSLIKWKRKNVEWRIGCIPFGGYVRISGMEISSKKKPQDESESLYSIPGGFFSKAPWKRIIVLLGGPLANIFLALFVFSFVWLSGGREKNFSEKTRIIGWVNPKSSLYLHGLREGDIITKCNKKLYKGSIDFLSTSLLENDKKIIVEGIKGISSKVPFSTFQMEVSLKNNNGCQNFLEDPFVLGARYLIYDKFSGIYSNELVEGSPLGKSGISYGDRLVWANGEYLFSLEQLSSLINDNKVFLVVQRNNEVIFIRQPKFLLRDLILPSYFRHELMDWQYEAGIRGRWSQLVMIPYIINNQCYVEDEIKLQEDNIYGANVQNAEETLLPGDKILSVNGSFVCNSYDLLKNLQKNQVLIIVKKNSGLKSEPISSWEKEDKLFLSSLDTKAVDDIVSSMATRNLVRNSGDFALLNPVIPKSWEDFNFSLESKGKIKNEIEKQRRAIMAIRDKDKKTCLLEKLNENSSKLMLGISLQDKKVIYNPGPLTLFQEVVFDSFRTLKALFFGKLKMKWLSGPVGIVRTLHFGWSLGVREALFWIGLISSNLAILNLLPFPILDGGYIVLCLWEMLTQRRVNLRLFEKTLLLFAFVLIGFLIFLTIQDIGRLFSIH